MSKIIGNTSATPMAIPKLPEYDPSTNNSIGKEGNGENSVIFNDYENNIADGDFTQVSGIGNRAGSKCFRLDTKVYKDGQRYNHNGKYYLKDITPEILPYIKEAAAKKPFYTLVLNYNYDLQGKLTGVGTDETGTYIEVTNYLEINANTGTTLYADSYIFIPDYADIGTDTIGKGAHVGGMYCQALADGAQANGLRTKVIGQCGETAGRDTLAGYASYADGRETTALGENSRSHGCKTTVLGFAGFIDGSSSNKAMGHIFDESGKILSIEEIIEAYKKNPFSLSLKTATHVEGRDNLGLGSNQHIEGWGNIGIRDNVHIDGQYAEIDYEGKYIHITGNGTDDENRSNAHTIDEEGNGWYAKDVYIKGHTEKDEALTLNKYITYDGYGYKETYPNGFALGTKIPNGTVGGIDSGLYVFGGTEPSCDVIDNKLNVTTGKTGGRLKLFNFLTPNTNFTTKDIGKAFRISFDYMIESGTLNVGLMGLGGTFQRDFYISAQVPTKERWSTFVFDVVIDEQMVNTQCGLVTLDFSQKSNVTFDNIKSESIERIENILFNSNM